MSKSRHLEPEHLKSYLAVAGLLVTLSVAIIPAFWQYTQSLQEKSDENFRNIVEKLSAGNTGERIAAASSLGLYVDRGKDKSSLGLYIGRGKDKEYYDESIDILINAVSIERDPNVLNAIGNSLERIDKTDYRNVINKLININRNLFIYQHPIESWKNISENDLMRSQEEFRSMEALLKEDGLNGSSRTNNITLENLEKNIQRKQETYSEFDADLTLLKENKEFVGNFIASFLNKLEPPIKDLNFYQIGIYGYGNEKITLTDIEITDSKIYRSSFSVGSFNTSFYNVTISDSTFGGSIIAKSKFVNSEIEASLFTNVIFDNVNFSGSEFKDVYFADADLTGANFKGAKGLKEIYFYKSKNIDKAKFDDEFKKKLDDNLGGITKDKFKDYINNESKLELERRDELFDTVDKVENNGYIEYNGTLITIPSQRSPVIVQQD